MSDKTLCIYHGNCADGFTAAWIVRKALGESVEFHPGVYQDPPPNVTNKHVILVDFSYKRPVMEQLIKDALSVTILDHHISAIKDLEGVEGLEAVFDVKHSGAAITWSYFFPHEEMPDIIKTVEDRDLWKFQLPYTREIQAAIFSYEYTFENWDMLMTAPVQQLIEEGKAITRKHMKDIHELLKIVTREMMIGGHKVLVANLPYVYSSEAGHILATDRPFGACYWDTPTGRVFSLRSHENGEDVSKIAMMFGGGGHKNASGFKVSYTQAEAFEMEFAEVYNGLLG